MATKKPESDKKQIAKWLATLPPERRAWIEKLHATVLAAAPDAMEVYGYGMPGTKYKGKTLAYYGAWKTHYAYYPATDAVIAADRDALKPLVEGRGTFQFPIDKPVPVTLVKKMVKARMKEIDAMDAARKAKKPARRK